MVGEKKDNVLFNDKFNRAKFHPTLSHFGGKAAQGWVALTASGMASFLNIFYTEHFVSDFILFEDLYFCIFVEIKLLELQVCVCMLHEGKEEGKIELHSLAPWRTRVAIADIAYTPSGDMLAIVSDGNLCR